MFMKRILLSALVLVLSAVPAFASAATLTVGATQLEVGSVPKGAQRVQFLSLAFRAACDAPVTIESMVVVHTGLGDPSDISRVYVMDGRRRLTRARGFDTSDQTANLRFIPRLTLKACEEREVSVVMDISADADAAGEHGIMVEFPHDILTDATVSLSSKIQESAAVVRPKTTGSVNVAFLSLTQPLKFGAGRTLARFRLEADGEANQQVHSITLTNAGKATDADLKNLRIQNRKGDVLTNVAATMDGDHVHLTFDPPLTLDRNDEILLELKGDIQASRRRTVRFMVEEPSDLEATPAAR